MHRRRGRDTRNPQALLERDAEQALIERLLGGAHRGVGGLVLFEGSAGKGKSSLLNLAGDLARDAGLRVLGAYGSDLERHIPFGVAIQLFEPWWRANDVDARVRLVRSAPRSAVELLRHGPDFDDPDAGYATVHGLFRLTTMLVEDTADPEPIVMLVDDLHWTDGPSLRFLAYLAARVRDLPVVLVLSTRQGEPSADGRAVTALRTAAGEGLARLKPLSGAGVAALVRDRFPDAADAFVRACLRVTSGNPFLLLELLDQVHSSDQPPDAETAKRLGGMAPDAVLDAVMARLGTMPADVRSVAIAAAVFGDGAPLRTTAELAGLDLDQAARAADSLAEMQLLCQGEPLSFVHPLTRQSVLQSIPPLDRGRMHGQAARILDREGASDDAIASHLLHAPAAADPRTVTVLHAAGRHTLAGGSPGSAVGLLRRALNEGVAPLNPALLTDLAQAEAADGRPEAIARLEQALAVVPAGGGRARLALALGGSLVRQGRALEAVEVLDRAVPDAGGDDAALAEELFTARVIATSLEPGHAAPARALADQLLAGLPDEAPTTRLGAVAHIAAHRAARGSTRAEVRRLAELAWSDGRLLAAPGADESWPMAASALLIVDELERSLEICASAAGDAAARGATAAGAIADHARAWALYERGAINAAAELARGVIDSPPLDSSGYLPAAYVLIAHCHLQAGELREAESALAVTSHPEMSPSPQRPWLLLARARVRLAQRRYDAALADALAAGARWEEHYCAPAPPSLAWRATAALAHRALGDADRAAELAEAELALAVEAGMTRAVSRNLRILGLIRGGTDGLELLAQAVDAGTGAPRLEHIATLIAYGGALRRGKQRAAAREPLGEALARAHEGGATALADEAEAELAATGARVRTAARWGPEALTASERRVAVLASQGLTTRQMAETLFVTTKTVEYHLRHIYQKLGVNSRDKLADALELDA